MPVLLLVLYGYAINLDVNHIQMLVYDQDRSPQSRALIGDFIDSGYFDLVSYAEDNDAATNALNRGTAKVALVIPPTYTQEQVHGRTEDGWEVVNPPVEPPTPQN